MARIEYTPADDIVDEVWGKEETPARDAMEARLKDGVDAYFVGEAIRNARLKQRLTQGELGKRVGVRRSQICKLERGGCNITIPTMGKVFKALGVAKATLDIGLCGKVTLW